MTLILLAEMAETLVFAGESELALAPAAGGDAPQPFSSGLVSRGS